MEIRLLDVAQQELDEAIEYYNERSPGLGDHFLLEALAAFERIKKFQKAWNPYTENTRRCQTHRFPYGVIYQKLESEILIVAVANLHKRPGYWLDRIRQDK